MKWTLEVRVLEKIQSQSIGSKIFFDTRLILRQPMTPTGDYLVCSPRNPQSKFDYIIVVDMFHDVICMLNYTVKKMYG